MSPYMRSKHAVGTHTDVWAFGMTIGVMFGLDNICPDRYKGAIPEFIRDCFFGKNDIHLHRNGINLSHQIKDLVKNMLMKPEDKIYSIQQVMEHPYV